MTSSICQVFYENNEFRPGKVCIKGLSIFSIFIILTYMYVVTMDLQRNSFSLDSYFQTRTTADDREQLFALLRKVDALSRLHKFTYFIYGGTLLGSYRHHGFIPWDDDVDLMIDASHQPQFGEALHTLLPYYKVTQVRPYLWKLSAVDYGSSVPLRGWKWPFLDLFFFTHNATHLWHKDTPRIEQKFKNSGLLWKISDIFPLQKRPFGPDMFPAPRNTLAVLESKYDINSCQTNMYSHRAELSINSYLTSKTVPCQKLSHFVPLVHRKDKGTHTVETLMLGSNIIQSHTLDRCQRSL